MNLTLLEQIADQVGIPVQEILGRSRLEKIVVARQVFWYCLNLQKIGHKRISKSDGRTRQAISSGIRSVKNLVETDHPLIAPYKEIINQHQIE